MTSGQCLTAVDNAIIRDSPGIEFIHSETCNARSALEYFAHQGATICWSSATRSGFVTLTIGETCRTSAIRSYCSFFAINIFDHWRAPKFSVGDFSIFAEMTRSLICRSHWQRLRACRDITWVCAGYPFVMADFTVLFCLIYSGFTQLLIVHIFTCSGV